MPQPTSFPSLEESYTCLGLKQHTCPFITEPRLLVVTIILHIIGVELVVLTVCIASIQHVVDAVLSEDMAELSVVGEVGP